VGWRRDMKFDGDIRNQMLICNLFDKKYIKSYGKDGNWREE